MCCFPVPALSSVVPARNLRCQNAENKEKLVGHRAPRPCGLSEHTAHPDVQVVVHQRVAGSQVSGRRVARVLRVREWTWVMIHRRGTVPVHNVFAMEMEHARSSISRKLHDRDPGDI